ncbi:MAG: hypothetical protein R2781_08620 [Flavobacteriaceae bacterium]
MIVDPLCLRIWVLFEVFLCDDELQGSTPTDEISTFNLTLQDLVLTAYASGFNGELVCDSWGRVVRQSLWDPTLHQNTITPQTVVARIESGFGCSDGRYGDLYGITKSYAQYGSFGSFAVCDEDNDGFVEFDLTQDPSITGGDPDFGGKLHYGTQLDVNEILPIGPCTLTTTRTMIVYGFV